MRNLKKKIAIIIAALVLAYSTCICAMAEVITYDNGSQGIILGKKSEDGTFTVVNNAFVICNTSGNAITLDLPDVKGFTLDNGATLTMNAISENPLSYKYNAKKHTLVITEKTTTNKTKESKNKKTTKPSGKNVATLSDLASIIQYATSIGWTIDQNDSGYDNVYFMSTPKNTYHIMLSADASKNGIWTSDGYEFLNVKVDEMVLFLETMTKK